MKAQTKLTPGTYRLTEDLPPLRKDKRRKHDWRCRPMKAGTLFFYTEWTYAPDDKQPERTFTEQRIFPITAYSVESVAPNESCETRELEELLRPVEETPSLWLRRAHSQASALDVLDVLVANGKLTMRDIAAALHQHLTRCDDDEHEQSR